MSEEKVNGCGCQTGILKYIPIPHARFFVEQCNVHDVLYNIGGTKDDRQKADARLYNDMVKHSTAHFDNRIRQQYWFITLSLLYYISVRLFGKGNFNYKKK